MRDYDKKPMTRDEALVILGKIIKGREDYVFEGLCTYLKCGKPNCIIGHVFVYAGIPLEIIVRDARGALLYQPRSILKYFTPAAIKLLNIVQEAQDGRDVHVFGCSRASWGQAVAHGINMTRKK